MILALLLLAAPPAEFAQKASDAKLTQERLTQLAVDTLSRAVPGAQITVEKPLVLAVVVDRRQMQVNLATSWVVAPAERAETAWQLLSDAIAALKAKEAEGAAKDIVPLVRGEVDEPVRRVKAGTYPQLWDPLVGDLVVLYAFDSPTNFLPVTAEDLARLRLQRAGLRALALANLRARIPPVEKKVAKTGVTMFVLPHNGGNFESSLLLFDELWVDGFVAAASGRDLVFGCPESNVTGVDIVKGVAAKSFGEMSNPVSKQVLVRRKGKWTLLSK